MPRVETRGSQNKIKNNLSKEIKAKKCSRSPPVLWWIFYSKWRKYRYKHWLIISINFVNRQIIIPALCQLDCQIPNQFSTKHVHSSSEAMVPWVSWSDGSHAALPLHHNQSHDSPCARYPWPVNHDVTCQTTHGSTDSSYSAMKLEKIGTDVYLQTDFNTIVVRKQL